MKRAQFMQKNLFYSTFSYVLRTQTYSYIDAGGRHGSVLLADALEPAVGDAARIGSRAARGGARRAASRAHGSLAARAHLLGRVPLCTDAEGALRSASAAFASSQLRAVVHGEARAHTLT